MKRWIYAYRTVTAPPGAVERILVEHSADLLQLACAAPDEPVGGDGSFVVDLEGSVGWFATGKRVRIWTGGVLHRPDARAVVPVRWHAEPLPRLYPRFEGSIEVQPLSHDVAQLTLAGSYDVPFGPLGWALNATLLRGVAQGTAEQLLSGLAREVARSARLAGAPH